MPHETLSAAFVNNVTCPSGKAKENYYDTSITGFILEVRANGGKTYALRYRDPHGKLRQHKIGNAKDITFEKARQAAARIRSTVVLGGSPSEERKTKRNIPTLAEFARDRYMPFVKGYKVSWDSDDSYLRNHLLPKFGACHLDQITQLQVVEFHHAMKASGYAAGTCNRMVILLRYIYNLAKKWNIPGAEINATASVQLYSIPGGRERFLNIAETQRLKLAIEASPNKMLKYIVALLLLTGARKQELLKSRWEDFDIGRRSWRIPLCKSGKSRHVPLSLEVIDVLAQIPRWENCPYVVPNPKTLKPFVSIYCSWHSARTAAGLVDVVLHSLRHSAASNMCNSGISLQTVGKVLGHTQMRTTMIYAHLSNETLLAAVDAAANATGTNWGAMQSVAEEVSGQAV